METKYKTIQSASEDLIEIESLLKQHMTEREHVLKLVNFTLGEGEDLVTKIAKESAESCSGVANQIKAFLVRIDEKNRSWDQLWQQRNNALRRCIEASTTTAEKKQITRDIDLLLREVETRRKNIGSTYEEAQINLVNIQDICQNMTICAENITRWKEIVEQIVQTRRHQGLSDYSQSELVNSIAEVDKMWSTLHVRVKDYRDLLVKANAFHKLYEEVELWTSQKSQLLSRLIVSQNECHQVREVEFVLRQVEQNIDEVKQYNETKMKCLSKLAVQLYGENHQQPKVKHIVAKNVDILNNLIQLKTETERLKSTIAKPPPPVQKSSQVYHELPLEEPERPPDFRKRLESAIVFTGSKHCFECAVEGTRPFTIQWFQNGMEIDQKGLELNKNLELSVDEINGLTSLTLKNAAVNDSSLFSCRVSNELGTAETSAYLKVKDYFKPKGSAPLIVTALESIQLNAESNYTLECIISSEPEPVVTWFKDNVELDALSEEIRATFKVGKFMNVRQLSIINAMPDMHSGTYTCRAKNEYGEADCSCGIFIRSKRF